MVRLRDSWPFSLSSAPTVGNPCRPLQPESVSPLRDQIALLLAERSIYVGAAQVLLTHGANHALDRIIRHLVEPGDAILVDSPGYYPLFGKLRLVKARTVGVRRTADGPDLDDLT